MMIDLISIHIAKTGGRSFFEILKNEYGDTLDPRYKRRHYFPKKNYDNELIDRIPENVKVLHGHLLYKHVKDIHSTHKSKVITWFRDPVDRVISNYYFLMLRLREDPNHKQIRKCNYSLMDYANDSIQNKMSRYLSGIELEDLFFFGFLEDFERGVDILAKRLNWRNKVEEVHINTSVKHQQYKDILTSPEDITIQMRREIAKLNNNDVELFKRAKIIYKEKFGA